MTALRPLTVDDLSTARYIHTASFASAAKSHYAQTDIDAFVGFVRSPSYADLLLGNPSFGAWIGDELVGVAAWSPGEGRSPTARILVVSVRPLFTSSGLGRLLVEHIEEEAHAAGFRALEVSAPLSAVEFFEGLGYLSVRQGGWKLPQGPELAVVFMRKADFTGMQFSG